MFLIFPVRLQTLLIQLAEHCQVLKSKFCSSADAFPGQHHSLGVIRFNPFTCTAVLRLGTLDGVAGVFAQGPKVTVAHKQSPCFHELLVFHHSWPFPLPFLAAQLNLNTTWFPMFFNLPQGFVIYHHACVLVPCMDQRRARFWFGEERAWAKAFGPHLPSIRKLYSLAPPNSWPPLVIWLVL